MSEKPWGEANSFEPPGSPLLAWLDATDQILPHSILAGIVAGVLALALLRQATAPFQTAALAIIAIVSFASAADLWYHGWHH